MSKKRNDLQKLTGSILLATPTISTDYLQKTMIYICEHSEDGAMGLVINKLIPDANIINTIRKLRDNLLGDINIYFGGMEEIDKCFILYSDDNATFANNIIKDQIALTISDDILKTVTTFGGPERKIICMGCCTWSSGQLENEIAENNWIPIPADEALIFGDPRSDKWSKAFLKIGLRSKLFVHTAGNA